MKIVTKKWFSKFPLLTLVFLLFFSMSVEAATTKLPVFYKDPVNCDRCGSELASAPNGTVYQYLYDSAKINAISPAGKPLWSYKLPKSAYLSYKTGVTLDAKGNIYFGYENSNHYYLAKLTSKGALSWAFKMENPHGPGAPVVDKVGNVYFGSGNPTDQVGPHGKSDVYALSPNGKKLWKTSINGDSIFGKIQFDQNGNLVLPSTDDEVVWNYTISKAGKPINKKETYYYSDRVWGNYSLDSQSSTLQAFDNKGKLSWSYKINEDTTLEHVTAAGTVFLSSGGHLLSITKGKVNWKVKMMGEFTYHPKGIYMIDHSTGKTVIKVVDEKTGKVKLSKQLDADFYQYTILSNGNLLVSQRNVIYKVALSK
jgi:hypothetical protein